MIHVTAVERVVGSEGIPTLVLTYRLPNDMVPHADPVEQAKGKSMNDDPKYGGHTHMIAMDAIPVRMALYGYDDPHDAIESMIHEIISAPHRDPNKNPGKADLAASKGRHQVQGVKQALRAAGLTLPTPPEEVMLTFEHEVLLRFGRKEAARMRGVKETDLPDLSDPVERAKPLKTRLPRNPA